MSWLRLMEESIKEPDEDSAEISASDLAPVRKTVKKHGVVVLIREMWPVYLIEIFVIILGISITLALEAWREGRYSRTSEIYFG